MTCLKPTAVSVQSLTRQHRERHLPGAGKIVLIPLGTEQMSVRSTGCTAVRVGSLLTVYRLPNVMNDWLT